MVFDQCEIASFAECYPGRSTSLRHNIRDDQRLEIEALLQLAKKLPADKIEYNAGNLPLEQDPDRTPINGLSIEETIERIRDCQSWMVLKNVETDAQYAALLNDCIDELSPILTRETGAADKREGFIFMSSPGSVTPFHMDPEHNILLQIAGRKTMYVLPQDDLDVVSPEQHERFHGPNGHRNLKFAEEFTAKAKRYDLQPGDAVYVPVKAPHWVENGEDVSVSFSITWRSRLSDYDACLHRANAWLRAKGRTPSSPGDAPLRDRCAVLAHKIATRISG